MISHTYWGIDMMDRQIVIEIRDLNWNLYRATRLAAETRIKRIAPPGGAITVPNAQTISPATGFFSPSGLYDAIARANARGLFALQVRDATPVQMSIWD